MNIESSLGSVQFRIELKPINGDEATAARDMLAALHLIYHNAGSKARPDTYSEENADKVLDAIAKATEKTFKVVSFAHEEYVREEFKTLRKSLEGVLSEDAINDIIAKKRAAKTKTAVEQPVKLAMAS